jgi:two-component system, OmpR family, response regulator RegX3
VAPAATFAVPAASATAARTPSPASVPPVVMSVRVRVMATTVPRSTATASQARDKTWQSLRRGPYRRVRSISVATRILIVEDEASIAEPFARLLEREGFEATVAGTAAGALDAARTMHPDLVLLDLALPDGDGRDVCRTLRGESGVPVIMLTARGTETDRIVGLELGADDYVVKPFSAAEVIARIRAVLRRVAAAQNGTRPAPAGPIRIRGLELDLSARRATVAGAELELSRKEFDLLAELVRHAGEVVTREDLMSRVWDENWFGSTKTLDVHVGWVRRKLGDASYIDTVRGVGFRFAAPAREAP